MEGGGDGVVEWWSGGVVLENTTGVFKSLIETRSKRADRAFWNARQRLEYPITPTSHTELTTAYFGGQALRLRA
jgi:hypothetical protein